MGITKNHIYPEMTIALARLFKALGHPARLAIIDNLLEHDNLNCNDLRKYIQLAQSTISKHIKELFEAGILGVSVVANNAYYKVDKAVIEPITEYIDQLILKVESKKHDDKLVYYPPIPLITLRNNTT